MSLISIVIPVYNGEKTILQTIRSAQEQTFKDFELLVMNDGSTDNTLKVIESSQDPRLKVLSVDKNSGNPAVPRNRGIEQSAGEFIAFLDADDLWAPETLEEQMRALRDDVSAAVAYSWVDIIDEKGILICPGTRFEVKGSPYPSMLVGNMLGCGSNGLYRKKALQEVGLFDESLAGTEDWDLLIRLSKCYSFVCVPHAQVFYRLSQNSLTTNIRQHSREYLKCIKKTFSSAPLSLKHLKRQALTGAYPYFLFRASYATPSRVLGVLRVKFLFCSLRYNWKSWTLLQFGRAVLGSLIMILSPSFAIQIKRWRASRATL